MRNLLCQLPEARNALPTADCVSAEQTKVAKHNYVARLVVLLNAECILLIIIELIVFLPKKTKVDKKYFCTVCFFYCKESARQTFLADILKGHLSLADCNTAV